MVETLVGWLVVGLLYLISSIYLQLRYKQIIRWHIPAAMFGIGAAIFIGVNRYWWFSPGSVHQWLNYVMLAATLSAWIAAFMSARYEVRVRKDLESIEDQLREVK